MELLYIWIDNYKNISRQGFNFSPKYRFEFTPKIENNEVIGGNLACTKNDFPDNFFGEGISNVTAIIGENGSGKSSLLGFIKKPTGKYLFVYVNYTDKKYFLYSSIKITSDISIDVIEKNLENFDYHGFNNSDFTTNDTCQAISFLLKNNPNLTIDVLMFIPDELRMEISSYTSPIENIKSIVEVIENLDSTINSLKSNKEYFLRFIFLLLVLETEWSDDKIQEEIAQIVKKDYKKTILTNKTTSIVEIQNSINDVFANFKKLSSNIELQKSLNKFLEIIDNILEPASNVKYSSRVGFSINAIDLDIHGNLINNILKLNELGIKLFNFKFLKDNENLFLSSGETMLLYFYSKLIKYNNESKLYLIDEGELGLHPQWQKKYLKGLIDTLLKINTGKKTQIILTSHSPFLVSDLPKENIIFLRKAKPKTKEEFRGNYELVQGIKYDKGKCIVEKRNEQTFGQNIHTLFADSFFMEGGLIGEFAKNKINTEIIDVIRSHGKENHLSQEIAESLSKKINMIGEPLIKRKLTMMLEEVLEYSLKEIQIAYHQFKINQLQKGGNEI